MPLWGLKPEIVGTKPLQNYTSDHTVSGFDLVP